MKPNLITRRLGSMLISVQEVEEPTPEEWDEYIRSLSGILRDNRANPERIKVLVVTGGGAPSAAQRKRLQDTIGKARFRVAVVSDSIKVRFVASTIALFLRDHRSFSMEELPQAYGHLQLTPAERTQADVAIRDMTGAMTRRVGA